jgi:transposase
MTELPDNILHLPQYQVLGCKSTDDEMHFQVDVPDPIACEECGVQGEFVRFGKRDVPHRDLPIQGKRVTLWVVRRRYTCRACKTTFRPQLPEVVDGFRMTLRLHEYVEKESFNHPYTFVAAQRPAWTRRRCATSSTPAPSSWGAGTASRRPASWALTSYT